MSMLFSVLTFDTCLDPMLLQAVLRGLVSWVFGVCWLTTVFMGPVGLGMMCFLCLVRPTFVMTGRSLELKSVGRHAGAHVRSL